MAQAQHQEVAIVKGTHISTRVILTEALLLLALATLYGGTFALPWLRWGFLLFAALGALWLVVLVPLQQRLITLAQSGDDDAFDRTSRLYAIPGAVAGVIALVVFALMVLRPE